MIWFFIPGRPVTKKNAKHAYANTASGAAARRKAKEYADKLRFCCIEALVSDGFKPDDLPVYPTEWLKMVVVARYHGRRHHDAANIPEIICDALQSRHENHGGTQIKIPGLVYKNDRQIITLESRIIHDVDKEYPEGVHVYVWPEEMDDGRKEKGSARASVQRVTVSREESGDDSTDGSSD